MSNETPSTRYLCQRCGNPKDASEAYEMPGDTASAASVTDPALLRMAEAGVNWQCGYCGSHQRRFDGACAQCGAEQAAGKDAPLDGRPAARAGLHAGDRVLSIDGRAIDDASQVRDIIRASGATGVAKPMVWRVERAGQTLEMRARGVDV